MWCRWWENMCACKKRGGVFARYARFIQRKDPRFLCLRHGKHGGVLGVLWEGMYFLLLCRLRALSSETLCGCLPKKQELNCVPKTLRMPVCKPRESGYMNSWSSRVSFLKDSFLPRRARRQKHICKNGA